MKKIVALIIVFMLVASVALADFDLSALSFDDLLSLSAQVNAEIMSRPEWKETTVPSGQWVVGEDIPAGFYSISPSEKGGYLRVRNESGKIIISQGIRKETDAFSKYELKEGYSVEIENGSLIFAPAKSLGF